MKNSSSPDPGEGGAHREAVEGEGIQTTTVATVSPSPSHSAERSRPLPLPQAGEGSLALLITVVLTAFWAGLAWRDLGTLRLPDPDDMLRLARIRDWLDGQAFADAVQQRLGPPGGTALHWSRLPELVPAFVTALLAPLIGATRAEIAAVVFWPELLLFLHLLLTAAIARRLGGSATAAVAVVLAALAFPAIDLFAPGRIDHHALQIVLVEAMLLALLGARMAWAGLAAGTSLLVGVETAPVIAAAMAALGLLWAARPRPVAGFGAGLMIAALAGYALFRAQPASAMCDGFTRPVFALMLLAGGAWLVLAALAPRLPDLRWRAGAAAVLAALVLAAGWALAPSCFASPYGSADPVVATAWPAQPGEMGGLLAQTPGTMLGWAMLPLLALIAAMHLVRARTEEGWRLILAMVAAAVAVGFVQLRGLWFAAALAPPLLAPIIVGAKSVLWRAAAWLVSMGLLWQAVGTLGMDRGAAPQVADCSDRRTLQALDRLDTGAFAAPMTLSAYLVGGTRHRALGGPYHRNLAGNRALAELFRTPPDAARLQANLWAVDYIALCPTPDGGLPAALRLPNGLGGHLVVGAAPDWLDEVPLVGSDLRVWRVQLGPVLGPPR